MTSGVNPFILRENLGYMAKIVQSISILIGLGLFMMGIFRLKRYGEMHAHLYVPSNDHSRDPLDDGRNRPHVPSCCIEQCLNQLLVHQ